MIWVPEVTQEIFRTTEPSLTIAPLYKLSGIISGTGTVISGSTGTLTLSGPNTYTGGLTLTTGTVNLTGNQNAATGSIGVAPGSAGATLNIGSTTQTGTTGVTVAVGNSIQVGDLNGGASGANNITAAGQNANTERTTITNNGSFSLGRGSNVNLTQFANWTQNGVMSLALYGGFSARLAIDTNCAFTYSGPGAINLNSQTPTGTPVQGDFITVNGGTFTMAQGIQFNQGDQLGEIILEAGGILALSQNITNLTTIVPGTTGTSDFSSAAAAA